MEGFGRKDPPKGLHGLGQKSKPRGAELFGHAPGQTDGAHTLPALFLVSGCSSGHSGRPRQSGDTSKLNSINIPGHYSNGLAEFGCIGFYLPSSGAGRDHSQQGAVLSERIREVNGVNDTTLRHLISALKMVWRHQIAECRGSQCFRIKLESHPAEPGTWKVTHQIGVCSGLGNMPMMHTQRSNSIITANKLHYFKPGTTKAVTPLSEQAARLHSRGNGERSSLSAPLVRRTCWDPILTSNSQEPAEDPTASAPATRLP